MFKILFYFLGVFLVSVGTFFTILYLNLLTIGYSFLEFVKFIIRSPIFWCIIIGLVFIALSLERWIKNELLLRHNLKLERDHSL